MLAILAFLLLISPSLIISKFVVIKPKHPTSPTKQTSFFFCFLAIYSFITHYLPYTLLITYFHKHILLHDFNLQKYCHRLHLLINNSQFSDNHHLPRMSIPMFSVTSYRRRIISAVESDPTGVEFTTSRSIW